MDIEKAASELGFNCQLDNGVFSKDDNGVIKKFTSSEMDAINAKALASAHVPIEEDWIKLEIKAASQQIEDLEDQALSAKKLRAYRYKLKQYKTDLYMPNITRPKQ